MIESYTGVNKKRILTLKPQDQNLNSHLLPTFISYRSSREKLIKHQANSSCVIISVILMTTLFYKELILQGEIWCWSLLRLEGLNGCKKISHQETEYKFLLD